MPQEPKKRHSRQRQGKRRASIKLSIPNPAHRLTKADMYLREEKTRVAQAQAVDENSK